MEWSLHDGLSTVWLWSTLWRCSPEIYCYTFPHCHITRYGLVGILFFFKFKSSLIFSSNFNDIFVFWPSVRLHIFQFFGQNWLRDENEKCTLPSTLLKGKGLKVGPVNPARGGERCKLPSFNAFWRPRNATDVIWNVHCSMRIIWPSMIIPASTELAKFLYILCRKKITVPLFRHHLPAGARGHMPPVSALSTATASTGFCPVSFYRSSLAVLSDKCMFARQLQTIMQFGLMSTMYLAIAVKNRLLTKNIKNVLIHQ